MKNTATGKKIKKKSNTYMGEKIYKYKCSTDC